MKRLQHPQFGIATIFLFGAAMFVVSTIVVFAQDFIEPSGQAPTNNVVDFITVSDSSQARVGQLRINDVIQNIPGATDSTVDVKGNTYLQGDATFGKNLGPTLSINATKFPYYVASGTAAANGKFNISATHSFGLYASSALDDGIFVNTKSGGTPSTPVKNIFGQTTQVATGEQSAGVMGVSTHASGYGIYAVNTSCTSYNYNCGFAGQFYGNVVVTGRIIGDGRGIFKTWTLNDGSSVNAATGISMKTIDITNDDFISNSYTYENAIGAGETFISMSVLTNNGVYDPHRSSLPPSELDLLAIGIDNNTGDLSITKHSTNPIVGTIVVTLFYHQELEVSITVDEDINGDSNTPDIANPYNSLVGSDKITTFIAELGGGGYEGSSFSWEMYKDTTGDSFPDTICIGTECGTVLISVGETTSYVAPTDFPGTEKRVWLRASWTSDATVNMDQQIDLYKIQVTSTPADDYLTIGGVTHNFDAIVECPGACPGIEWVLGSSFGNGESINPITGIYAPPTQVVSGQRWTGQVKATLPSIDPTIEQSYSFDLLPFISITATLDGENLTSQGPWNVNKIVVETAQVGISCGTSSCTNGHTLTLEAVAEGIPASLQHDFSWSFDVPAVYTGEQIASADPINTTHTNNIHKTTTYTAPVNYSTTIPADAVRSVRATWRFSTGIDSIKSQVMNVALGKGTIPRPVFSRDNGVIGNYTNYKLNGFASLDARKIYQVCTTSFCDTDIGQVQIIDWSTLPIPITVNACGALNITGVSGDNPQTINFSYTGAPSGGCSDILYLKAYGDTRAISQISVTTTEPAYDPCSSCYCTGSFKDPVCCNTCYSGGGGETLPPL